MNKSDLLKKKYGFRIGSYKYIIPGGELMRYIGQTVVCVTFTKEEDGKWKNSFTEATINSLGEFDPILMTWLCKYKLKDSEEELEVRIMPEGYSFEGKDPEETGKMIRFVPLSKHFEMIEDEIFYSRLEKLWEERETLKPEALTTLSKSKGQEGTLKYTHNIGALVKLDDDLVGEGESKFLWIRLHKVKFHHNNGSKFNLRFSNDDRSWSFLIDVNDAEFAFEDSGKFKIIDLSEGTLIKG